MPKIFNLLKETILKHRQIKRYSTFSRATLNETFTAKYNSVLPSEHPKWDQNPKFKSQSETTSIPTPFVWKSPPPPPPLPSSPEPKPHF